MEPRLLEEPQGPEFPGGEEALAQGRRLLEPSLGARVTAGALRVVGGEIGARGGARGGEALGDLWLRWLTPTAAGLSRQAQKLERLQPLLEEAMRKGPVAVAALHAQLLERSPEYREAIAE